MPKTACKISCRDNAISCIDLTRALDQVTEHMHIGVQGLKPRQLEAVESFVSTFVSLPTGFVAW